MPSWSAFRLPESWTRWLLPAVGVVVVLLVTLSMATIRHQAAEREQELLFDARTAEIRRELVRTIEDETYNFRSAISFMAASHPTTPDQYQQFFAGLQLVEAADGPADPGVLFVEVVDDEEALQALVDREHDLGNTEFEVRGIAQPGRRYVITRTSKPPTPNQFDLMGLDVTAFEEVIQPIEQGDQLFVLRSLDRSPVLAFVSQSASDPAAVQAADSFTGNSMAMLLGIALDQNGELVGYTVRFMTIGSFFDDLPSHLLDGTEVSLWIGGRDEPMVIRGAEEGQEATPTDLRRFEVISHQGEVWSLETMATSSFGPPTGLFDQVLIWAVGLAMAVLVAGAGAIRSWQQRKLERAEQELAQARAVAATDGLTGLLNRAGFMAAAAKVGDPTPHALFFLDLDGFKEVNDLTGHAAGDDLLVRASNRLAETARSTDLVARLGGDEFVVMTTSPTSRGEAVEIATRIVVALDSLDRRVSSSVGIALSEPSNPLPLDELLNEADAAMYEAKRAGGNRFRFAEEIGANRTLASAGIRTLPSRLRRTPDNR